MKKYHYKVIHSTTKEVVLDSSLQEDFGGFISEERAYMAKLGRKNENRLSDLHTIITYEVK